MSDEQNVSDVKFTDLFNPNQPRADKEKIEARLAVCNDCYFFNKKVNRCRKCGCFMNLKTTLLQAKCPEGKW